MNEIERLKVNVWSIRRELRMLLEHWEDQDAGFPQMLFEEARDVLQEVGRVLEKM